MKKILAFVWIVLIAFSTTGFSNPPEAVNRFENTESEQSAFANLGRYSDFNPGYSFCFVPQEGCGATCSIYCPLGKAATCSCQYQFRPICECK